jgi:hypothetical protein
VSVGVSDNVVGGGGRKKSGGWDASYANEKSGGVRARA